MVVRKEPFHKRLFVQIICGMYVEIRSLILPFSAEPLILQSFVMRKQKVLLKND